MFPRDLDKLLEYLEPITDSDTLKQLVQIRNRLVALRKKHVVKINHSVLEILCARHLIDQGYEVVVEYQLEGGVLNADIYAVRVKIPDESTTFVGTDKEEIPELGETLVVEVETGFVPPDAALNPTKYRQSRITAKIARYGGYSDKFSLATPSYHVLQIPPVLLKPPKKRDMEEIHKLKELCDSYYFSPAIKLEPLVSTRLDSIYILNVDFAQVLQIEPHSYLSTILQAEGLLYT